MSYETYIFDLDGTLLDTLNDLTTSCNYALRMNGMKERSIDEVRHFVGNGVFKLIERAVPNGTQTRSFRIRIRHSLTITWSTASTPPSHILE